MANISISDTMSPQGDIQLDDKSQLGQTKLQSLHSPTAIVSEFSKPLDQTEVKSATFGAKFGSTLMDAARNSKLSIKAGANACLSVLGPSEGSLFGDDPYVPQVEIGKGQYWVVFELDTTFDVGLNQSVAMGGVSGFGVGIEATRTAQFTSYSLFDSATGALPTLKEAAGRTLSNFTAVNSAQDVRNQKPGTAQTCDISGTLKLTGSYSLPIAANKLSLASANLPFKYTAAVQPQMEAKLSGCLAITGDYIVRFYRKNDRDLELGAYKKKGTELSANFTTAAGIQASVGQSADLIGPILGAVVPGVDVKAAGLPDEEAKALQKPLKDCVDRSLSISLNLSCSAAFTHEAAIVYHIDLSRNQAETDAAIDAALSGDWSLLGKLSNAEELRNVAGHTRDSKHSTVVNLLGIYNYESVADFVGACTIVHSPEDGSITITDKETASRVSVASMPYVADADRLRAAIAEASLATMTYAAMNQTGKLGASLKVSQSFLLYKDKLDAKPLHKDLLVGVALQLINQEEWQRLGPTNPTCKHVRIWAQASFESDAALRLFFSDTAARTPRALGELKQIGRNTLSSLLDRSDPVDDKRRRVLNGPEAWARMDDQQFPKDSPASYSDWYDITFWAGAVSKVAPALKDALEAVDQTRGPDASTDPNFMKKRAALANALAAATRNSHAAFEPGWPISVMCALSENSAKLSFQAGWDGKTYLDKPNLGATAAGSSAKA